SGATRAGAVVAALALVAAACGGSDDDGDADDGDDAAATTEAPAPDDSDTDDDGDEPEPEPTPDDEPDDPEPEDESDDDEGDDPPATTAAPEPEETPEPGGEIVVATLFEPFGLDVKNLVGNVFDGTVSNAIYSSLMTYDADRNVVPELAESLESDDQQNWTLTLNPGIEFADGTPFDADAVKFNLDRHADLDVGSRAYQFARNITDVTVVDETTLEITLEFPWAAFPETLAGNLGKVGSPTAIQADPDAFNRNPVGAGAFQLVEWATGERLVLEPNPNYWVEDQPYLDRITVRAIADTQTRIASAENGEVDLAQSVNGAEIANAPDRGLVGYPGEGPGVTIWMNNNVPPFDDVRVRRAALIALDKETIFDVVYEGAGQYPPNEFIISNDSEYSAQGVIEYPQYDPDEAAALIAEYEAENGPVSFTYSCYGQSDLVNMAQIAQQMWSAAGIDAEIEIKDQLSVVGDVLSGNYSISCFGATGQQDPDLAFYSSLHSDSANNYAGYSNPEVDEALDAGRRTADFDERYEAYLTVQEALATDVPFFQVVTSPWGWFGNPQLGGMQALRDSTFDAAPL
ncbi:MAG: ABC transporter substrate-binding protein, partial [Ilumatobacteraceae bacterium]